VDAALLAGNRDVLAQDEVRASSPTVSSLLLCAREKQKRRRRASGRLTAARKCSRRVFCTRRGTAAWTLRLKRKLPRGRYTIAVRAVDKAGNRQAKLTTRTLRVR
jgi:hypothetical protein